MQRIHTLWAFIAVGDLVERPKKLGQRCLLRQVLTVSTEVLRNEGDLTAPASNNPLEFNDNIINCPRSLGTSQFGNDTK